MNLIWTLDIKKSSNGRHSLTDGKLMVVILMFLSCVGAFCLHTSEQHGHGGQKQVPYPTEMELLRHGMVLSYHMVAGTKPWSSERVAKKH